MMVAITIGDVSISTYWLMLIIGVVGMFVCTFRRKERFGLNLLQCAAFTLLLTAAGVIGAMLLYFLESGSFGGVSFFGSVYLIPLLMPLFGLLFRLKPGQTLDICGPCVAIMIGCMRVNCFLSGCCGGWEVCMGNLCFSWPTQAIDSIADFAIMVWLLQLESNGQESGKLYPLFMVAYSAMRFLNEFLRDTPKDWLYMSHGQWFAVAAVVIGFIWLSYQSLIKRKEVANENR